MPQDQERKLAFAFFKQHPLMTLTTLSQEGAPQNAAVYTYIDEANYLYFVSREGTRKYNNIIENSLATLSTYDENVLMFAEVHGNAEVVNDKTEAATILTELQKIVESRKSSYWTPPVSQISDAPYVFFKLTPKEVTFANYEQSSSEASKPMVVSFEL